MYSRLQYISQGQNVNEHLANIQAALSGGVQWIQLRLKNSNEEEIRKAGIMAKEMCSAYGAIFILNDHPAIAREINADGVHLGLSDMPVPEARDILGKGKIIGGTANTLDDVLKRVEEGCDYIGLGPFQFTTTKEKLSPVLGLRGYENIMDQLVKRGIFTPVYAIGGITETDIPLLMDTGVYGIAASGLINGLFNKQHLIAELNSILNAKPANC
jgi:thiamine-phosphate pyrophosphorylase